MLTFRFFNLLFFSPSCRAKSRHPLASRWRGLVARAIIRHRLFLNTFFESKKSIQKNSLQEIRRRYALTFPAVTYSLRSWFFTLRQIAFIIHKS